MYKNPFGASAGLKCIGHCWRGIFAASALGMLVAACANQYAVLYVTSEPEVAKLWSGKDGQYLGQTPATIRYIRTLDDPNPVQVVIFEKAHFQTAFKVVKIDKWSENWLDANINQNTVTATLKPSGN